MTPDEIRAQYRSFMAEVGETVTIRRYSGTGNQRTPVDVGAMARVTGYEAHELAGPIKQGDRKLIVLAEDLEAGAIALPVRNGDKAVVRGREMNIEAADDSTRRVQGVLVAYEIRASGP